MKPIFIIIILIIIIISPLIPKEKNKQNVLKNKIKNI